MKRRAFVLLSWMFVSAPLAADAQEGPASRAETPKGRVGSRAVARPEVAPDAPPEVPLDAPPADDETNVDEEISAAKDRPALASPEPADSPDGSVLAVDAGAALPVPDSAPSPDRASTEAAPVATSSPDGAEPIASEKAAASHAPDVDGNDRPGRSEPAPASSARAEPTVPTFFPVPVATGDDGSSRVWELLRQLVPMLPEDGVASTFGLVALVLLSLLGAMVVQRTRDVLPTSGILPRLLSAAHFGLRLLVLFTAVALVARLLPAWIGPALPWVLLAAAAALGWSTRDLLPDFVAGLVLLLERKLRRGVWLSTDGCSGTVERIGLRATWLRDARGYRVAVPNRRLLTAPVASVTAVGAEHEVSLCIATSASAARIRQALRDAVLLSPWVPPDASPIVLRDADQPSTWHVRARLLDMSYAARFEGSLLERIEEILEVATESAGKRESSPPDPRE